VFVYYYKGGKNRLHTEKSYTFVLPFYRLVVKGFALSLSLSLFFITVSFSVGVKLLSVD